MNEAKATLLVALCLAAAGCATFERSLAKGDFAAAEKIAAKSTGSARSESYGALGTAAFDGADYRAAARYFELAGDAEGLGRSAARLLPRAGAEDGEALDLALASYAKAVRLQTEAGAARALAREGAAAAVDFDRPHDAKAILRAAGFGAREMGDFIAERYLSRLAAEGPGPATPSPLLLEARAAYVEGGNLDKAREIDLALADSLLLSGKAEEALVAYVTAGLGEAQAALRAARALEAGGGDPAKALELYLRAGDVEGAARTGLAAGARAAASGEPERAAAIYASAGLVESEYALSLGAAWESMGDFARAAGWYLKAARPELARAAYEALGGKLEREGDYPAALAAYESAGRPDSGLRAVLEGAAKAAAGRGEHEKAGQLYLRAGLRAESESMYARAGYLALERGDFDTALACFRSGGDDGDLEIAYRRKAEAMIGDGKLAQARTLLTSARGPAFAYAVCFGAAVEAGLWDEATALLAAIGTPDSELWLILAEAAADHRNYEAAAALREKGGLSRTEALSAAAAEASQRGDRGIAIGLFERAGRKDRAEDEIEAWARQHFTGGRWEEGRIVLSRLGLSASELRARLIQATQARGEWEAAYGFRLEGGSSAEAAAIATAEAAAAAADYPAAVAYYGRAGLDREAKALAAQAAEAALALGDPKGAGELYRMAGDAAGAALATAVGERTLVLKLFLQGPDIDSTALMKMLEETEAALGRSGLLAAISAATLTISEESIELMKAAGAEPDEATLGLLHRNAVIVETLGSLYEQLRGGGP